jgi:hypothetical protein
MSREFGSYSSGYFDTQMEYAAEDCQRGRDALTRQWGVFLEAFKPVAVAIASSEACDSGPDYPIMETISAMPALRAALDEIERHVSVYRDVAQAAVREHLEKANA